MRLSIGYSVRSSYLPESSRLEAALREGLDLAAELINVDRGMFDVRANGDLIYSEKDCGGCSPMHGEAITFLRDRASREM